MGIVMGNAPFARPFPVQDPIVAGPALSTAPSARTPPLPCRPSLGPTLPPASLPAWQLSFPHVAMGGS